jgi:outer membrane protein OmpA-like peptidoglycan-associated protein
MTAQIVRFRGATLVFALSACLAAAPLLAAETPDDRGRASKQADAGAVAGLAIGAAAAGPVGAVIGASAGVVLGEHYHKKAQQAATLASALKKSEAERTHLEQSLAQLDSRLAQEKARGEQLDATLQHTDELGLDVSFRTDDDAVTAQDMGPLLKFGALVASMPQAQVLVAGFADPRGSEAYNNELSLHRAECVAAVLTLVGVPRERIAIEAHGKSGAGDADGDLDAYALERRVTVRLQLPPLGQVARRD